MLTARITSAVLSLVIAFGLWWYVVNNVSMEDDITFNNIPVVREGESVLNERNLMITEISAESVSMNLTGSREDLNKVDSGNMSVKINDLDVETVYDKHCFVGTNLLFHANCTSLWTYVKNVSRF